MVSECEPCCVSMKFLACNVPSAMVLWLVVFRMREAPVIQVFIKVREICSMRVVGLMAECCQMRI